LPGVLNQVERFEHGGAALLDEIVEAESSAAPPGRPRRHMIFLHGWGANRESLRGIASLFENTHTVHLIDLPGFGEAPAPPPEWGTSEYADLVQHYLARKTSGPFLLVGHSFGARVTIRLAARRLTELEGIVLMAAPGLPAPAYSRTSLRRRAIRLLRRSLRALAPITGSGPVEWHTRTFGSTDYLAAGDLRQVFVRVVSENYTEDVKGIQCPVLLLWGSDDRETPPWLAHRFKELLDGRAVLEMLPHKDAHLYSGTGAHLCAFKIRDWLEAHARS